MIVRGINPETQTAPASARVLGGGRWGAWSACVVMAWGCQAGPVTGFVPTRHDDRMSAWLEYATADDVDTYIAFADDHALNVNVALIRDTHDRAFLETACDAAWARNMTLRLWPLLPEDEGYWPNQGNAEAFSDWTHTLLDWAEQWEPCRHIDGVAIDMEMDWARTQELVALGESEAGLDDIAAFFTDDVDEERFEDARAEYQDLCGYIGSLGLRCMLTTLPVLVDDALDGDETLALALGTPVEGIAWHHRSFQVYRSLFQRFSFALSDPDQTYTSGLITSYATDIVALYGDEGALDLGTTADGVVSADSLADAAALQADIAAGLAAGIDAGRVTIYSLEGAADREDGADWVALPEPEAADVDDASLEIREVLATLDAIGG